MQFIIWRRINKEHPKYAEYIAKCEELASCFDKIEEKLKAKYPDWHGQDHPADGEIAPYRRKFHADLLKLQVEYLFLFEDKYAEYIVRREKLASEYCELEERLKAKYPDWHGQDYPADGEITACITKYHADLHKLRNEYSFLFDGSNA